MARMGICANPECLTKRQPTLIIARGLCRRCYRKTCSTLRKCDHCQEIKAEVYKLPNSDDFACRGCRARYRHKLFQQGVLEEWGPGYKECVLCHSNELAYSKAGFCFGCFSIRNRRVLCDRCSQRMGRNFNRSARRGRKTPAYNNGNEYTNLCKTCASLFDFPWAFGYEKCRGCGENDQPHNGRGFCISCTKAELNCGLRTCIWCGNKETRRSFAKIVLCRRECKQELTQEIKIYLDDGYTVPRIAKALGGLSKYFIREVASSFGIDTNVAARKALSESAKKIGLHTMGRGVLAREQLAEFGRRRIAIHGNPFDKLTPEQRREFGIKACLAAQCGPSVSTELELINAFDEAGIYAQDAETATTGRIYFTGFKTNRLHVLFDDGRIAIPDFKVKGLSLVVEAFGEYWHSEEFCKRRNLPDYKYRPWRMREEYAKQGYKCLVYWEDEIQDPELVPIIIGEIRLHIAEQLSLTPEPSGVFAYPGILQILHDRRVFAGFRFQIVFDFKNLQILNFVLS